MKKSILITVDFEDWFQVENFKEYISFSDWEHKEYRLESNTEKLIELFDKYNIKATFFILGWNAERLRNLVRKIDNCGHEVASHGYFHEPCYKQNDSELRNDLKKSKDVIEEIIGANVMGYRAPTFSIDDRTISILKDIGYSYDSSYNNLTINKRHGTLDFSDYKRFGVSYRDRDGFCELPISNLNIGHSVLPWGGGGYFRMFPTSIFNLGIKRIIKKENVYNFYLHPWEIDTGQPRVKEAKFLFRLRHYLNLDKCMTKLESLLILFKNDMFLTCTEYLEALKLRHRKKNI